MRVFGKYFKHFYQNFICDSYIGAAQTYTNIVNALERPFFSWILLTYCIFNLQAV